MSMKLVMHRRIPNRPARSAILENTPVLFSMPPFP
jgi:hypothetical protein